MSNPTSQNLQEQSEYYRARSLEYDEWWQRQGRYDHGPELNAAWFSEIEIVRSALEAFRPAGRVLELACGTGNWTGQLSQSASEVTALDASPEMIEINRAKVGSPRVRYVQANLFDWKPDAQYDVVFFGFWLSHVPEDRFADFWRLVRQSLSENGRVFFVDSRRESSGTAVDQPLPQGGATLQRRRLNDGREFQVYKVYYQPALLSERLRAIGWEFSIHETAHYFIYGSGRPCL